MHSSLFFFFFFAVAKCQKDKQYGFDLVMTRNTYKAHHVVSNTFATLNYHEIDKYRRVSVWRCSFVMQSHQRETNSEKKNK